MPVEGEILFRSREEILQDYFDGITTRVPDAHLGDDSNIRMLFETMASVQESAFLSLQIFSEDMYVATANPAALDRYGNDYGVPRKSGLTATGVVRISGAGGTVIPVGTEVAYESGLGDDPLYFRTTSIATIPNPGIPSKPTVADLAIAGNLTGTFEYAITFMTAEGETAVGVESDAITLAASRAHLSAIPLGGPGTTARRVYRQVDGSGDRELVTTINDNTTTVFDDNVAVPAGAPPGVSTAQRVSVAAESESSGLDYNVLPNSITVVTNAPSGITGVTNPNAFSGGTDPEESEDFRVRLQQIMRNPETGSPSDVQAWVEAMDGVELATVYPNNNLGVATNGHTTVRFSTPGGGVPGADLIADVQGMLDARGLVPLIFHAAAFTQTVTAVDVTVTRASNYTLADVTPTVQKAIQNYINGLAVGETLRISGIIAAVVGLPGILDVVVNTPATNQATGATAKRSPGAITVN